MADQGWNAPRESSHHGYGSLYEKGLHDGYAQRGREIAGMRAQIAQAIAEYCVPWLMNEGVITDDSYESSYGSDEWGQITDRVLGVLGIHAQDATDD